MQMFRQRKYLFAVAALVLVFAGCKGESPTAPTSTNPPTTTAGGGTPPPSTANISLTVSNPTPQVSSSSIITATVTDSSNQPVANGTAVEFDTNLGTFTEANAQTVIRTTTNGVATVTLTSAVVGTATVQAIVANVKKTATVSFSAVPINPPPPDTTPVISGINPTFGRPQGGEVVTITGKNFRTPLRVLFDFGAGTTPKDATIISSASTQVQVLTPSVDLGATAQQLAATVKLINQAGTPSEVTVTGPTFTYQLSILTPKITTVSPASGPIDGGTRVTIYGEGFQSPVQVFWGAAEVQPIQVLYNQITVLTPSARDATPTASTPGTGSVDVKVININSATQVTLAAAFRYIPKMSITAVSPVFGSSLGGTQVRIDGDGFNSPITVDIGGVRATTLSVSGTEVLVSTGALPSPCSSLSGQTITVTNVDNGDTAVSAPPQTFSYIGVNPVITSVVGTATTETIGSGVNVTVQNPGIGLLGSAIVGFTLGGFPVTATPQTITNGTGSQLFVFPVPTAVQTLFPTVTCQVGALTGTQLGPVTLEVVFTNSTTGCTASAPAAITIQPPGTNACVLPPQPSVTTPSGGSCATPGTASVTSTGFPRQTTANIVISNAPNSQPLNITGAALSGTNASEFLISPTTASNIPAGGSQPFTLTFIPATAGAKTATVTFTTNSPTTPTLSVCVTTTGAP